MKKAILGIGKCVALWVVTLAVLVGLMVLSACISNELIKDNLVESSMELMQADPKPAINPTAYHSLQDNYADAILLGVISCVYSAEPFTSAINTGYFDGGENGEAYGLYATALGVMPNTDYTRYWHGSMTVIRPLLTFTDLGGIKVISAVVMLILLGMSGFMLIRRKNTVCFILLLLSLILVQVFFVPFSLEFIIAFMVTLLLLPLYIRFSKSDNMVLLLSVIGGTLIAFTDFLTTETITLLIPLIVVLFTRVRENEQYSFKNGLSLCVKSGIGWILAYAATFITKWVLATAVTGVDKFSLALSSFFERTNGSVDEFENPFEQVFSALFSNFSMLFPTPEKISPAAVVFSILIYILLPLVLVILMNRKKKINISALFVILAFIPLLRFMALSNHSYLHNFFTYRALSATIFALLSAVWVSVDKKSLWFSKQPEPVRKKKGGRK